MLSGVIRHLLNMWEQTARIGVPCVNSTAPDQAPVFIWDPIGWYPMSLYACQTQDTRVSRGTQVFLALRELATRVTA